VIEWLQDGNIGIACNQDVEVTAVQVEQLHNLVAVPPIRPKLQCYAADTVPRSEGVTCSAA
jgi:hypothetical protein